MSSGTVIPPLPIAETPVMTLTECEVVIQERLRKTQRHVKGVDIAEGLVTLAVGILGYLLVAAVIDHWLVEGGLGFGGRLWLWAALVGVAGAYFARRVLPKAAIFACLNLCFRASVKNSMSFGFEPGQPPSM